MVTFQQMQASNGRIATDLPAGMVAVFTGATAGIGQHSMLQFAKHANKPRIYFVGRNENAAAKIKEELKEINPDGEYQFIKADLNLMKNVDEVCKEIKSKETAINVLFMTQGAYHHDAETEEGLYILSAASYFSRVRFALNLLPLITKANSLRRVVSVSIGTKEGEFQVDDIEARGIKNLFAARCHRATWNTLTWDHLSKEYPTVSFIHEYPGFVQTNFGRDAPGLKMKLVRFIADIMMLWKEIPISESGQRHTFFATSARYPSTDLGTSGVPLTDELTIAQGVDGKEGSGMYSIEENGESAPETVVKLLEDYKQQGVQDKIWKFVEEKFVGITGQVAL